MFAVTHDLQLVDAETPQFSAYQIYTDPHDKIYTVADAISLETHNVTQMSFEW